MARAARHVFARLRCGRLGIEVSAVSRAESARLNRTFRGKRRAGDVLTFGAPPAGPGGGMGDVCLCLPLIRRDARRHGIPFRRWLATLTVHGVLHAMGYHHDTPAAAGEMNAVQRALVGTFV